MRNLPDPDQKDFFRAPAFPVRAPAERIDLDRFRLKIKRAMSKALRQAQDERGEGREEIAARLAAMPGFGSINRGAIDAWCAPAKSHDISLVRFKALVRAARAPWLWDEAVAEDGLTLLAGDEARLAEIALLQQKRRELSRQLAALIARPVGTER